MNKDNAKEYLPLVQALADGKVIQFKTIMPFEWVDIKDGEVDFFLQPQRYRIRPEPREIWFNRYNTGVESGPYESKEKAIEYAFHDHPMVQVRYREVIE